jgi:hypothetical protein
VPSVLRGAGRAQMGPSRDASRKGVTAPEWPQIEAGPSAEPEQPEERAEGAIDVVIERLGAELERTASSPDRSALRTVDVSG